MHPYKGYVVVLQVESELVSRFLEKEVGILHHDHDGDYFLRGKLVAVTPETALLSTKTRGEAAISLNSIIKIIEMKKRGDG